MSREVAVCTTGTGSAAAKFCAAVILCLDSQWCRKFVLGQTSCLAIMQEAVAAMNSLPFDKTLRISLAVNIGLETFPGKSLVRV